MKRYRDYNTYLREIFGERVQKISLDAGLSCPNRDGTISRQGCIFCDSRGSGTGAMNERGMSIDQQMESGRRFAQKRYKARKFIAYFQSFSNTYASPDRLKELYDSALCYEGVVGLSVGTRPDCVDDEILALLNSYMKDYLIWIEYGLQSSNDATLERINRGHDAACFKDAVIRTHEYGLNVCAHVILGLPGETRDMIKDTARFIAALPVSGLKIHMLYVTEGTILAEQFTKGEYQCLEREEFVDMVVEFLELIPPDLVIQRLIGDPVRAELLAPLWSLDKTRNLKLINKRLEEKDTWQGKYFNGE